jgi:uncharacterized membrane protein (DUF2068 family)
MNENSAKVVIKVYSVLNWIAGIAYFLLGLAIILLNKGISFGFNNISFSKTTFVIIGGIFVLLGIFIVVLAINLWKFKNWSRIATIVLTCIGLLFSIFGLISNVAIGTIISIVISLIFLYLFAIDRSIIAVFKKMK